MAKRTQRPSERPDVLAPLLAQLRPSEEELAALRTLESKGDMGRFTRALAELDRKYKHRDLDRIKGLRKGVLNPDAFRIARRPHEIDREALAKPSPASVMTEVLKARGLRCDCVVPFEWVSLTAMNSMTGPNRTDVARGLLGAQRQFSGEYRVYNPGDTTGKALVHRTGQLHITFEARLPEAGRWCVLLPA